MRMKEFSFIARLERIDFVQRFSLRYDIIFSHLYPLEVGGSPVCNSRLIKSLVPM